MDWSAATNSVLGQCLDTFSINTTYVPVVGSSYSLRGIFDDAYQSVDPNSDGAIQSVQPILGVRLSDMEAAPANGDHVTIDGTDYRVVRSEPDGQGGSILFLHKV